MRAIILAGGKGTRLRPYTTVFPKPLMPVGTVPILEILIRQLVRQGFDHITITVGHMAKLIEVYCGDGSQWGTRIDYSHETTPLGTMGPLKMVPDLPENFLVLNGDVLTDLPFADFFKRHCESNNSFSISSYHRIVESDFGVLETGGSGKLEGFKEKPRIPFEVSMGVYTVHRSVVEMIPAGRGFGFDDLMLALLKNGHRPNVYRHSGVWLDIGRPDDYERAQAVGQDLLSELFD